MTWGTVIVAGGTRADDLMNLLLAEVHEEIGKPTTFYLRYSVLRDADGDLFPLKEERLAPGAEIAVFQRGEGFNDCLVKGYVFSHEIRLIHGVEGSTVEVIGADSTLLMDRETKITQWADNTSDSDAVTSIISSYGLTPDVEDTDTRHMEDKRTLIQHDTDLNFVRMLARRNGYLFWVRADETLTETAYFKPPQLDDVADAPLLTINLENPNMRAFDITWDVERPTSIIATAYDGAAKATIDGSGVPPTTFPGDSALGEIVSETRSTSVIAAVADVGDLTGRAAGVLNDSSWFVQATCTVSAREVGAIIHAHTLVNVDGVGKRFSGSFFVAAVQHVMNTDDHLMTLTLVRNGWKA
jgi:phage protein D